MNKVLIIILVLVAAAFVLIKIMDKTEDAPAQSPDPDDAAVTYSGPTYTYVSGSDSFTIQYSPDKEHAQITLRSQQYDLTRVPTGSGTQYEGNNGEVVFSEHQSLGNVTVNGDIIFENAGLMQEDGSVTEVPDETVVGSWRWLKTVYNNDTSVTPEDSNQFVLQFMDDGTFGATTDCNNLTGSYTLSETGGLTFGPIAATKKLCPGEPQEAVFSEMLGEVAGYIFTGDGTLALTLKLDTGTVLFAPVTEN